MLTGVVEHQRVHVDLPCVCEAALEAQFFKVAGTARKKACKLMGVTVSQHAGREACMQPSCKISWADDT